MHNIQEGTTFDEVEMNLSWICAALENHQAEHQSNMDEVQGKITKKLVAILVDPRGSYSYIGPNFVERFHMMRSKHNH